MGQSCIKKCLRTAWRCEREGVFIHPSLEPALAQGTSDFLAGASVLQALLFAEAEGNET